MITRTVIMILLLIPVIIFGQENNTDSYPLNRTLVPAYSGKLMGYIDNRSKEVVIAPQFKNAPFFINSYAIVEMPDGTDSLIDETSSVILSKYRLIERAEGYRDIENTTFILTDNNSKTSIYSLIDGWLLNPEILNQTPRFFGSKSFIYDGKLIYNGKKIAIPTASKVTSVDGNIIWLDGGELYKLPVIGVIRTDGTVILPAKYHDITHTDNGWWLASRIDFNIIQEIQFAISPIKTFANAQNSVKNILLDANGKEIRSFSSDRAPFVQGDRVSYSKNGVEFDVNLVSWGDYIVPKTDLGYSSFTSGEKVGIKSSDGNIIIPAMYDNLRELWSKTRFAFKKDDKWGVVNDKNEVIIPFVYNIIDPKWDNDILYLSIAVYLNENNTGSYNYGLADIDGNILIDTNYYDFYFNEQSQAVVKQKGGGEGVIDITGEIIIPIEYDYVYYDDDGNTPVYLVEKAGLRGMKDIHGKTLLPDKYGYISPKSNSDYVDIKDKDRVLQGFYNAKTKVILEPFTPHGLTIKGQNFISFTGHEYLLLSMDGKELGRYTWLQQTESIQTLFFARKISNNYYVWSLINEKGEEITGFKYSELRDSEHPDYFIARDQKGAFLYIDRYGSEYIIQ